MKTNAVSIYTRPFSCIEYLLHIFQLSKNSGLVPIFEVELRNQVSYFDLGAYYTYVLKCLMVL